MISKSRSDHVISPFHTLLKILTGLTWRSACMYGFCPLLSHLIPLSSLHSASVSQKVPIVTPTPTHPFFRETLSECPELPQCPSPPTMSAYNIAHLNLIAFITFKYTFLSRYLISV